MKFPAQSNVKKMMINKMEDDIEIEDGKMIGG